MSNLSDWLNDTGVGNTTATKILGDGIGLLADMGGPMAPRVH